jgi:hypothetical protein
MQHMRLSTFRFLCLIAHEIGKRLAPKWVGLPKYARERFRFAKPGRSASRERQDSSQRIIPQGVLLIPSSILIVP